MALFFTQGLWRVVSTSASACAMVMIVALVRHPVAKRVNLGMYIPLSIGVPEANP